MNRRRIVFGLIIVISSLSAANAQDSIQYYFSKAREAQQRNDTALFYSMITNAARLHPYRANILYQSAIASSLTGRKAEAIDYLTRAVKVNANADVENKSFSTIRQSKEFDNIIKLQKFLTTPVITSDTAFVIKNKTLHLECIADGDVGNLYFGSIHQRKIIKSDKYGNIEDFTSSGQDGLTSVFGIKVKTNTSTLWACSSPMREMVNYDSTATSGVFKYDLKLHKLLKKFTPSEAGIKEYVFGDLTLDPQGNAYVSDSRNNIIFRVNESMGMLDNFFSSKDFWNIQGITFSDDGSMLFIADYIKGVFKLDMKTKQLTKLKENINLSTKGIDGLIFYKDNLITIQNSISPMRVTKYQLGKNYNSLEKATIIDNDHPAFNEPTTGCMSGNELYYIANSLWSGYNEDHSLKSEDQLQDVVILKAKMK
jgi:sugar lactone lactonase YvrE